MAVPGLPLSVAQAVMEVSKDLTRVDFGDSINFLLALEVARRTSIDEAGNMMINFAGPAGSYPYASAVDLIKSEADTSLFADKIVFVG